MSQINIAVIVGSLRREFIQREACPGDRKACSGRSYIQALVNR